MSDNVKYLTYCGFKVKGENNIPTRITACYLSLDEACEFSQWFQEKIFPLIDEQLDKIKEAKCEKKLKK